MLERVGLVDFFVTAAVAAVAVLADRCLRIGGNGVVVAL